MKKWFFIALLFIVGIGYGRVYSPNESATFIVELTDYKGNPIIANCSGAIYYPDFSVYKQFNMSFDPTLGIYYYRFIVPSVYGTYVEIANCTFGNKYRVTRDTFYVSGRYDQINQLLQNATNITMDVSLDITGNITEALNQNFEQLNNTINYQFDDLRGFLIALHQRFQTVKRAAFNWWWAAAIALGFLLLVVR